MDIIFKLKDPYENCVVIDRTKLIGKLEVKIKLIEEQIMKNRLIVRNKTNEKLQETLYNINYINILNELDTIVCFNTCLEELVYFYKQMLEQNQTLDFKMSSMNISD